MGFVDEMQFDFMPVKGMIVAVFILRCLLEMYCVNGKRVFCVPRESF